MRHSSFLDRNFQLFTTMSGICRILWPTAAIHVYTSTQVREPVVSEQSFVESGWIGTRTLNAQDRELTVEAAQVAQNLLQQRLEALQNNGKQEIPPIYFDPRGGFSQGGFTCVVASKDIHAQFRLILAMILSEYTARAFGAFLYVRSEAEGARFYDTVLQKAENSVHGLLCHYQQFNETPSMPLHSGFLVSTKGGHSGYHLDLGVSNPSSFLGALRFCPGANVRLHGVRYGTERSFVLSDSGAAEIVSPDTEKTFVLQLYPEGSRYSYRRLFSSNGHV